MSHADGKTWSEYFAEMTPEEFRDHLLRESQTSLDEAKASAPRDVILANMLTGVAALFKECVSRLDSLSLREEPNLHHSSDA